MVLKRKIFNYAFYHKRVVTTRQKYIYYSHFFIILFPTLNQRKDKILDFHIKGITYNRFFFIFAALVFFFFFNFLKSFNYPHTSLSIRVINEGSYQQTSLNQHTQSHSCCTIEMHSSIS
jgi:hypothetical protein